MQMTLARSHQVTAQHREEVMGTIVTIDAVLRDETSRAAFAGRLEAAVSDMHRMDEMLSTWKTDSAISQVRRGDMDVVDAPIELQSVLEICTDIREASWGWFDPWALPGGVDPTGFVKGWVAQRARDLLLGDGVDGVIVNAAGDISVAGEPIGGGPYRVGVVNPFDRSLVAFVVVVEQAIATSGTYERGEHIISPATGQSASAVASATVTGPDLGWADALATALCSGGEAAIGAIDDLDGYEGLVIGHDGSMHATSGFPIDVAATRSVTQVEQT